jgi:hypothetical protein
MLRSPVASDIGPRLSGLGSGREVGNEVALTYEMKLRRAPAAFGAETRQRLPTLSARLLHSCESRLLTKHVMCTRVP